VLGVVPGLEIIRHSVVELLEVLAGEDLLRLHRGLRRAILQEIEVRVVTRVVALGAAGLVVLVTFLDVFDLAARLRLDGLRFLKQIRGAQRWQGSERQPDCRGDRKSDCGHCHLPFHCSLPLVDFEIRLSSLAPLLPLRVAGRSSGC